jgi:hypothetical protein
METAMRSGTGYPAAREAPVDIDIRIEVLEVEGLSPVDAPRFQHEIGQELARLVRENGLSSGALQSRSLLAVDADLGMHASDAGHQPFAANVAGAIYRALSP